MIAPAGSARVPARSPAALLAVLLVLGSWGCTREPQRQWQKFGQPYTMQDVQEFQRDKAECTREKKLDFDCMRARGWVDVSPDRPAPPPEPERVPGRPRY